MAPMEAHIPRLVPSDYAGTLLLTYSHQWSEHIRRYNLSSTASDASSTAATTVFGLAFYQASASSDDPWLCGCTSRGEVCIWQLPGATTIDMCDDEDDEITFDFDTKPLSVQMTTQPRARIKVAKGVLYSCKIVERTDKTWLVVAGEDGVVILDWATDIAPQLNKTASKSNAMVNPTGKLFVPFPSATQPAGVEINDCLIVGNHLYGASGDAFGCYKWDLETATVVTTYSRTKANNSGNQQTLAQVPDSNLLLMGGESGLLHIWDVQSDLHVDALDVSTKQSSLSVGPPPHKRRAATPTIPSSQQRWISSCIARDETWWMIAGGCHSSIGSNGFISTIHGPTRSLVSTIDTRETPQQLALLYGTNEAMTGSSSTLLSVANESYVSHWDNPFALDTVDPHRVWCNQASVYAVAVSADGRIATGGVGSVVDLFDSGSQSSIQLSIY